METLKCNFNETNNTFTMEDDTVKYIFKNIRKNEDNTFSYDVEFIDFGIFTHKAFKLLDEDMKVSSSNYFNSLLDLINKTKGHNPKDDNNRWATIKSMNELDCLRVAKNNTTNDNVVEYSTIRGRSDWKNQFDFRILFYEGIESKYSKTSYIFRATPDDLDSLSKEISKLIGFTSLSKKG